MKNLRFTLMVQGTTSDAGKSTLVAGLCRLFTNQGKKVLPFKPQNMALNSAVTHDGGEIGRAQALQAYACNVLPTVDMNPVLIKPSSDTGAQIIIQGKVLQDMDARHFHKYKPTALKAVMQSYNRLMQKAQMVFVEGAGSPAEINLRKGDIANMGFAQEADCPVIIVADIDKGGVFAHIVGTLDLLSPEEQARVIGFVINRFRGDIALLQPGLDWLEARVKKPVIAVVPYLHSLYLDSEDAVVCDQQHPENEQSTRLNICVPVLPRMSNHTDFDALRLHPNINLTFIDITASPMDCDLIILPGSKNVRSDLKTLYENDWQTKINQHLRYGGKLIGICGGYQMLGSTIDDSNGVEDKPGVSNGFGLINMKTILAKEKTLSRVTGTIYLNEVNAPFEGYEIHCGQSEILDEQTHPVISAVKSHCQTPFIDGFKSDDDLIFGTYMHGIFDKQEACDVILKWAGLKIENAVDVNTKREEQLNRLADTLEKSIDFEKLDNALTSFYASREY